MSRMNRLRKRREKLKTTITGLAIAIAIGGVGSLGSYAYFTATAEVDNSLSVTTGTMDTSLSGAVFAEEGLNSSNSNGISKEFTIKNEGSLKQKAKLHIKDIAGVDINNLAFEVRVNNEIKGSGLLSSYPTDGVYVGNIDSTKSLTCKVILKPKQGITEFNTGRVLFNIEATGEQINK